MLADLPHELTALEGRIGDMEQVLQAVGRMHAEWPRNARERVISLLKMLHRVRP